MDNWQTYSHPAFPFRWRYPAVTPAGHPVELVEEQGEDYTRVHLLAPGDEVYFEVRRFAATDPAAHYARHRAGLEAQLGGHGLVVTALEPATLAGLPAHRYAFRWGERERAAWLVVAGGGLCRIVYNPRSAVNDQILSTLNAP